MKVNVPHFFRVGSIRKARTQEKEPLIGSLPLELAFLACIFDLGCTRALAIFWSRHSHFSRRFPEPLPLVIWSRSGSSERRRKRILPFSPVQNKEGNPTRPLIRSPFTCDRISLRRPCAITPLFDALQLFFYIVEKPACPSPDIWKEEQTCSSNTDMPCLFPYDYPLFKKGD